MIPDYKTQFNLINLTSNVRDITICMMNTAPEDLLYGLMQHYKCGQLLKSDTFLARNHPQEANSNNTYKKPSNFTSPLYIITASCSSFSAVHKCNEIFDYFLKTMR